MATRGDPLAGTAPAFSRFGAALRGLTQAVRAEQRSVVTAARALDGVQRTTGQAAGDVKRWGTGAEAAGRATANLNRQAGAARAGLGKGLGATRASGALLKNLNRQLTGTASAVALVGKGAGIAGKLSGALGIGLKVGSGVMQAVNLAMKASPWGLVLSLLLPLAVELIDLALNSQTGQHILEQVFSAAGQAFKAALTVIGPVVLAYLAIVRTEWKILRAVVGTVLSWITGGLPRTLRSAGSALQGALRGAGDFLISAFHTAVTVIKAPANGLISLANWIIDRINGIKVLGKHVFPHLPNIPQLAAGGIVGPRRSGVPVLLAEAGEAEAVIPLPTLRRLLARTAAVAARRPGRTRRLTDYHEPEGRGAHGIAEDLLFLAYT
ncbi:MULTISPECIES: phage tail tape measure protein [Streptomyces]|uniref:hypothetical protein n=1 Tax=Streptomyces TaxID=1883 RepID=UPI00163BA8F6|nr:MULTISPECIES: hypothetical protein [Streptomyces]MBC2877436.1 hypothetical protein [Streptomyces sp. TYQ1024]UBI38234.1 hypothetical protein K7I03_18430 [Streptomyces mobaraensis]UKW30820.1 hypothetical protein MCU78_18390 [Streptomyces sp. TYQ1024]